jgi:hypothetical protein
VTAPPFLNTAYPLIASMNSLSVVADLDAGNGDVHHLSSLAPPARDSQLFCAALRTLFLLPAAMALVATVTLIFIGSFAIALMRETIEERGGNAS